MNKIAVIDGDILAYRSAATNEKRTVVATHKETLDKFEFNTATEFKEWAKDEVSLYDLEPVQTAGPLENALHILKTTIQRIVENAKCDSYHIVVSGKNNFRLDLPLPSRYKDNRKEVTRPLQLNDCRNYLIESHNAEISDGVEADDILVGYMYQGYKDKKYVVQCSLDKDAKHGPGWLFDWTTMDEPELIEGFGELVVVEKPSNRKLKNGEFAVDKSIKGKGRVWLYFQILFGDAVDNYKPCELAKTKYGEISAYNTLKDCTNDKEAIQAVVDQYKKWYPEPVTYKDWKGELQTKDWLDILQMYTDCAFMRRWEDDQLVMKDLIEKLGVEV